MGDYVYKRHPNDRLRGARLRKRSPSGSGRYLSRQELADEANGYLVSRLGFRRAINGDHIGRLERGVCRWPVGDYRQALRAVLGAGSDAELGFYIIRRETEGR